MHVSFSLYEKHFYTNQMYISAQYGDIQRQPFKTLWKGAKGFTAVKALQELISLP